MYDAKVGPIAFGCGRSEDGADGKRLYGDGVAPRRSGAGQAIRSYHSHHRGRQAARPAGHEGDCQRGLCDSTGRVGSATNWWVIGKDAAGAMYGGLELAEAVQLANGLGGVTNRQTNPYLEKRGIKFNIPLGRAFPELLGRFGFRAGQHRQHVGNQLLDWHAR